MSMTVIELFCPYCGGAAEQDHNAFWCDTCQGLWPKSEDGYWEGEGEKQREVVTNYPLPPHKAEKGYLAAGCLKRWWRIYTIDGKWETIGRGGETLKDARQNAREELLRQNTKAES